MNYRYKKISNFKILSKRQVAGILAFILSCSPIVSVEAAITWGNLIYLAGGDNYIAKLGFDSSNGRLYYSGNTSVSNPPYITLSGTVAMKGATSSTTGSAGYVPAPAAGKQNAFLRGDGTWVVPTDTDTHYTSHMYVGNGTATNVATTNGNTKIALADDSTVRNTLTIKGTGATSVTSDANGVITISSTDNNTTYSAMSADELIIGTATTSRTMTAKVVSDYVKGKTDDKLTDLSVSGTTITYTKGDGSTGIITTQDTTYGAGTTALLNTGTDTTNKVWTSKALADYVKGESRVTVDGTFAKKANTAAANITALDTAAKNAIKGLSVSGTTITYTKGDGTTGTITTQDTNTTYNAFTGATASVAGTTGLVTAPAKGQQGYVLHGDGTWSADKDTTYSAMSADELTTGTATTSRAVTAKVVSDYVKSKTDDKITGLSVNGKVITYTKGDGTTGTITTQDNNTTYSAMGADELSTGTATSARTMTAKVVSDYVKGKTNDKISGLSVSGKIITYTKGDGSTGTITTQDTTYSGFTGATSSAAGTAGLVTAPAKGQQGYVLHGDGTWKADADTKYDAMSAAEISTGTATTARSVTAKVLNDYVKSKTDDKITGLSVNGKVITYTKGDGTTGTITTQDTNTTYSAMGADELTTGTATTGRTVTAKVVSDYVKSKTDDKISNLSVNGNTITYTKGNGTTGSINLQDTTYTTGTSSVLSTGTETAGKLWSGKVLSDYVVGKVNTEATTRSTADIALDNRIGTLTANGYYVKKSATNNMATNMTLLDYQLKATNDNITGFASDITRNKNNIATLNTSVSSALSSVSAASSVIDLLSNTKADASLANLNASGKRVIANAAMNAVQEYMASQGSVATPSAPMMYNNGNSNGLTVNDAGNGSLHVGEGSYVNGTSSIAIGVGNQVNANNSGAFGDPSIINADESYVLGNDDTINTGATGSFVVGNDSVSSTKGGLAFGSNNMLESSAENSIALGNNVTISSKNSVALGTGSVATEDNVISIGNNDLQRKIVNVLVGELSENSNEAVTGSQLFATNEKVKANENAIATKADIDGSNINVDDWSSKLGVGTVEEGNTGLINGNTVFTAIQKIQDNQLIQNNGEFLSIGGNVGGNTVDVSNNNGESRVITGVLTDPNDLSSATNVGYVQSVSESIVNAVNDSFSKIDRKMNKVGANAVALSSLTPASFEGDEKWSLAASFGHYEGQTAGAVGAFYKPTENVMMNLRGSFAGGENMFGGGVAVSLSKGDIPGVTKRQLAIKVNELEKGREQDRARIAQLEDTVRQLIAVQQEKK